MPISRRAVIRQIAIAGIGFALLPACRMDNRKASLLLKKLRISGSDEDLLAALAATLIPQTSTPGAREVNAHLFALTMMDDCQGPEDQAKWMKGLEQFAREARRLTGNEFAQADKAGREKVLAFMEGRKDADDDLQYFYRRTKDLIIRGYTQSEHYLTKVQPYELVPGRYKGCVPV